MAIRLASRMRRARQAARREERQYKAVLIVGPGYSIPPDILATCKRDDCLIVGDGKRDINFSEIESSLKGKIGASTQVHIAAHGTIGELGQHKIQMQDPGTASTDLMMHQLRQCCPEQALQVHLWSCYGGAAAKDAASLPSKSCLVAHAPEDESMVMLSGNQSLNTILTKHLARGRQRELNYQTIVEDLAYGSGQKSFVGISKGQEEKPLVVKNRLPEQMSRRGLPKYTDTIKTAIRAHQKEVATKLNEALGLEVYVPETALAQDALQDFYVGQCSARLLDATSDRLEYGRFDDEVSTETMEAFHNFTNQMLPCEELNSHVISKLSPDIALCHSTMISSRSAFLDEMIDNGFDMNQHIVGVITSYENINKPLWLEFAETSNGAEVMTHCLNKGVELDELENIYKYGIADKVLSNCPDKKASVIAAGLESGDPKILEGMLTSSSTDIESKKTVISKLIDFDPSVSASELYNLCNKLPDTQRSKILSTNPEAQERYNTVETYNVINDFLHKHGSLLENEHVAEEQLDALDTLKAEFEVSFTDLPDSEGGSRYAAYNKSAYAALQKVHKEVKEHNESKGKLTQVLEYLEDALYNFRNRFRDQDKQLVSTTQKHKNLNKFIRSSIEKEPHKKQSFVAQEKARGMTRRASRGR